MEKSKALGQIVRLLTLTASYMQSNDIDRVMASLSIIADVMEESKVEPSDIEALLTVVPESPEEDTVSLRSQIENMVNEANSIADDGTAEAA